MQLGDEIKNARLNKNLSQEELAHYLGGIASGSFQVGEWNCNTTWLESGFADSVSRTGTRSRRQRAGNAIQ